MRENLFRGKKTNNGEWVEGGIIQIEGYAAIIIYSDYHDWHDFVEVIPETVGQYTGRNIGEEEIFDGDILENSTGIYIVCWHDEYLQWGTKNKKGVDCYSLRTLLSDTKRPCRKIGNIHDNPELLKGGEG